MKTSRVQFCEVAGASCVAPGRATRQGGKNLSHQLTLEPASILAGQRDTAHAHRIGERVGIQRGGDAGEHVVVGEGHLGLHRLLEIGEEAVALFVGQGTDLAEAPSVISIKMLAIDDAFRNFGKLKCPAIFEIIRAVEDGRDRVDTAGNNLTLGGHAKRQITNLPVVHGSALHRTGSANPRKDNAADGADAEASVTDEVTSAGDTDPGREGCEDAGPHAEAEDGGGEKGAGHAAITPPSANILTKYRLWSLLTCPAEESGGEGEWQRFLGIFAHILTSRSRSCAAITCTSRRRAPALNCRSSCRGMRRGGWRFPFSGSSTTQTGCRRAVWWRCAAPLRMLMAVAGRIRLPPWLQPRPS